MQENKSLLTPEECENIWGGGKDQWMEVQGYVGEYIRTHCPERVSDPQNIGKFDVLRFLHAKLPNYYGYEIGGYDNADNVYHLTTGQTLSHEEFMAYVRSTFPM